MRRELQAVSIIFFCKYLRNKKHLIANQINAVIMLVMLVFMSKLTDSFVKSLNIPPFDLDVDNYPVSMPSFDYIADSSVSSSVIGELNDNTQSGFLGAIPHVLYQSHVYPNGQEQPSFEALIDQVSNTSTLDSIGFDFHSLSPSGDVNVTLVYGQSSISVVNGEYFSPSLPAAVDALFTAARRVESGNGTAQLVSLTSQSMPQYINPAGPIIVVLGTLGMFFAFSFMSSSYAHEAQVMMKENEQDSLLRINGVSTTVYLLGLGLSVALVNLLLALFQFIVLAVFNVKWVIVNPLVWLPAFVVGAVQMAAWMQLVCMSYSTIASYRKSGGIMFMLLIQLPGAITLYLSYLNVPAWLPTALCGFPTVVLTRIVTIMCEFHYIFDRKPTLAQVYANTDGITGPLIAALLSTVLVSAIQWYICSPKPRAVIDNDPEAVTGGAGDADVHAEMQAVRALQGGDDHPLVMSNLSKVFLNKGEVKKLRKKVKAAKGEVKEELQARLDEASKGFTAVDRLSIAVRRGEVFGLLGPNGAGKSTAINCVINALQADGGDVHLMGDSLSSNPSKALSHIGVCPQADKALFKHMTVKEHLRVFAMAAGMGGSELTTAVDRAIATLHLEEYVHSRPKQLSGGWIRRVSVAMAIIRDPEVLLLDEPSSGLDPAAQLQIWDALTHISTSRCVMITTHLMAEADSMCHRVGIMVNGQLRCINTPQQIKAKYGSSYMIMIKAHLGTSLDTILDVVGIPDAKHIPSTGPVTKLMVPAAGLAVDLLFERLQEASDRGVLDDFSVSQPTLEGVFIQFARDQKDQYKAVE
eukprot:gnl/Dysnectes_brevis/2610_a3154_816.p1 GENE.gnl/Dysnectes_brevis/2610_a3154_816~~gnl/Dysnectes_brevis/2610_a3154_816.p1  ORF type:complete len:808 (+),score=215.78 gnl/Dysnectes_brevis/2610_a3154_816:109-2532(+)